MKTVLVQTKINKRLKDQVGKILKDIGLNHSEAINIFYKKVGSEKKLPFDLKLPNDLTKKVLLESEKGKNLSKIFDNTKKLFENLYF